jgi:hypothetical protein
MVGKLNVGCEYQRKDRNASIAFLTQLMAGLLLVAWSASQHFTLAVEQSDVYAGQLIAALAFPT